MTNPSRPGQTTFWDDWEKAKGLASTYAEGVRTGRWATPGQVSTDSASYNPIDQTAGATAGVINAATPRFGTDWDVQGFKEDLAAGRPFYAAGRLGIGTVGAALDVADPGLGHTFTGLAMAALPRMTPQAAQLMKLKREYQSKGGNPRTHPDEWTSTLGGDAPTLDPVKPFDINQLQVGDAFVPLVGDLSRVSAPLTQVGPYKFSSPVAMEGGSDFTRTGSAWASNNTIPQTILNKAKDVAETGGRPIGITVGMGSQGINYSHHAWEPMIRMMQASKVKAADIKDFDAQFRRQFPEWPGIKNEDAAIDFLRRQDTTARNPFVALHQREDFQTKNFPEGGPIRWAATEPDLRTPVLDDKPLRGATGYNVVEIDPTRPVSPGSHSSYTTDVPKKQYLGRAPLLPYEEVFRDWAASDRATRFPPSQASQKLYTFRMDQPTQVIDRQLLDELGRRYEALKKGR